MKTRSQSRIAPTERSNATTATFQSAILVAAVAILLSATIWAFRRLPALSTEQKLLVKLPSSVQEAGQVFKAVEHYADEFYFEVMLCYAFVFVGIQSFAIPGSIPLTVLGGALFSTLPAALLCSLCTAIGSGCCYALSWTIAAGFIRRFFSFQIALWRERVATQQDHLIRFIAILRLTPGWLLNLIAAHIDIPLRTFVVGTFLGISPLTFVYCAAGNSIRALGDGHPIEIFTTQTCVVLIAILVLLMSPIYLRRRNQN